MNPHADIIKQIEGSIEDAVSLLKPVPESWQATDVLPDMAGENWRDELDKLREQARSVPDELLVVLVGNAVTEEALPTYQTMINRHEGVRDLTGTSDTPWGRWSRGWTAEENRHGEILTLYLYLSGRINMRAYEVTTQNLIRNGFDPRTGNDPYKGLIYTSFQERATKISHGNTARLANESGDPLLGKICAMITGDESRHEEAYKRFVARIFEADPAGAAIAFGQLMKSTVTMPARLMDDGIAEDLFAQFSEVAQRIGVYTAHDYAEILEHLLSYWNIAKLSGLSGEAAQSQDYVSGLPAKIRALADRAASRRAQPAKLPFSWIFNRSA